MRPKTIAKNTAKAKEIFTRVKTCKAFSLSNGFIGEECPADMAEKYLHEFSFCRLRDYGAGEYHVHVNSNLWYELKI